MCGDLCAPFDLMRALTFVFVLGLIAGFFWVMKEKPWREWDWGDWSTNLILALIIMIVLALATVMYIEVYGSE